MAHMIRKKKHASITQTLSFEQYKINPQTVAPKKYSNHIRSNN
jgi:hypothetical protein